MSRHARRQVERKGFALQLHLALLDAGVTSSEQFAREIGKPLRTVQRWRNGETEPSANDFALLMRSLDKPASYFYPPTEEAA